MPIPPESALHRLTDGEICWIALHDRKRAEAIWSAERQGFHYLDGNEPQFIRHAEVYEWWPASVPW